MALQPIGPSLNFVVGPIDVVVGAFDFVRFGVCDGVLGRGVEEAGGGRRGAGC